MKAYQHGLCHDYDRFILKAYHLLDHIGKEAQWLNLKVNVAEECIIYLFPKSSGSHQAPRRGKAQVPAYWAGWASSLRHDQGARLGPSAGQAGSPPGST